MKKIGLVAIAAAMGIGFSSFTTAKKAPQPEYYYFISGTTWGTVQEADACPEGATNLCIVTTPQGPKQLYKQKNTSNPLRYN